MAIGVVNDESRRERGMHIYSRKPSRVSDSTHNYAIVQSCPFTLGVDSTPCESGLQTMPCKYRTASLSGAVVG